MSKASGDERMEYNRFSIIQEKLPQPTKLSLTALCALDNVSTVLLRYILLNTLTPHSITRFVNNDVETTDTDIKLFQTFLSVYNDLMDIYYKDSPLVTVFAVTSGLWLPDHPPPYLLKGHRTYIIDSVKKINLLTFILISLGCIPYYGFDSLQEIFFEVFCPSTIFNKNYGSVKNATNNDKLVDPTRKFLKTHGVLYLELKTQYFILGLQTTSKNTKKISENEIREMLEIIFPPNLMNIDSKLTTPAELEFIKRCNHRKEALLKYTVINDLINDYSWKECVKGLFSFCNKNIGMIIFGRIGRDKNPLFDYKLENFNSDSLNMNVFQSMVLFKQEIIEDSTEKIVKTTTYKDALTTTQNVSDNINDDLKQNGTSATYKMTSKKLLDVAILESAKSGVKKLKPKKNWSKEEEEMLQKGLEELGPSWSKILDMYGPGGTINEILKNRSQVQLKDKARNWKLRYLKSNKPLPSYLLKVTGKINRGRNSQVPFEKE